MPIDFRKLLPADVAARIDATRAEFDRLRALPDRFLARELVRLARDARALATSGGETYMADRDHGTYNVGLLWDVLPELAFRLGETSFLAGERKDLEARSDTDAAFRDLVASYLRHACVARRCADATTGTGTNAALVLDMDVANGNIVAVALDRACPPTDASTDWFASYLRTVGRSRFGSGTTVNAWTPAFQRYGSAA